MRLTKIVATIGPATSSPENIKKLIACGINVARLNFSHGTHEEQGRVIAEIQKLNAQSATPVAIMLDTKGPEIRTGDRAAPLKVRQGEQVIFTHRPTGKEALPTIEVDYDKFAKDTKHVRRILIDNGELEFEIVKVQGHNVIARALEPGNIGSRRHINLPGASVSLPSFTARDWSDIRFGVERGVDFISLSFVRTADDILTLKRYLQRRKSSVEIIAKIETILAVENISSIIDAADGVMVARGDLGAEMPFERVPRIQEEIVKRCRERGKTVIVATHMLESMIENPMPTRAEVTDVAHAAITHADATMLSAETASGRYPFKAVEAMNRILRATETMQPLPLSIPHQSPDDDLPRHEQAVAASILACNLKAKALIVISKHGLTARAVSHCRPPLPIFAFTSSEAVQRRLMISWGILPFLIPFSDRPERTVDAALASVAERKLLQSGDRVVIVSDIRTDNTPVMTIQIRSVR